MNTNNEELAFAQAITRIKAKKLAGKVGYTQDDVEDIQQELLIHLMGRVSSFDPSRAGYKTFISRVVDRKICNMLRDRHATIRDYRRESYSLNDDIDIGEEDLCQRVSTISRDDQDIRRGKHLRSSVDRSHLSMDMEVALASLSPEMRQAATLLQSLSITQAAREMGIPRRTFREKYMDILREAFVAKGMHHYFS